MSTDPQVQFIFIIKINERIHSMLVMKMNANEITLF